MFERGSIESCRLYEIYLRERWLMSRVRDEIGVLLSCDCALFTRLIDTFLRIILIGALCYNGSMSTTL